MSCTPNIRFYYLANRPSTPISLRQMLFLIPFIKTTLHWILPALKQHDFFFQYIGKCDGFINCSSKNHLFAVKQRPSHCAANILFFPALFRHTHLCYTHKKKKVLLLHQISDKPRTNSTQWGFTGVVYKVYVTIATTGTSTFLQTCTKVKTELAPFKWSDTAGCSNNMVYTSGIA